MVLNYLKIALRNLFKNKTYSAVNILGLAIGIASCVTILLYVQYELSYDRFHQNAHRIYRVTESILQNGVGETSATTPIPFAKTFAEDHPDKIEAYTRLFNFSAPSLTLESSPDRRFNEKRLFFADPGFFKVFSYKLKRGEAATALEQPNMIILTETMAEKYFGSEDPMGKIIRFENKQDFIVSGIAENPPSNAHFTFDALVSFSSALPFLTERQRTTWYWNPAWSYLLVKDDAPHELLPEVVKKYFPENIRNDATLAFQPLTDIHLYSNLDGELEPNSRIIYIYIFATIAVFILGIACINFMNLTTARSASRAKEIGMRKVLGSDRRHLIAQFLGESILTTSLSMLAGMGLVELTLQYFNALSGKNMGLHFTPEIVVALIGLVLGIGTLAGLYPAFYLSSFQPITIVKGIKSTVKGLSLRRILVTVQFAISTILIIGTLVAFQQLDYLKNANLGFQKDQVLVVPIQRSSLTNIDQFENFKNRLLQNPGITHVTAMEQVLGESHNTDVFEPEGSSGPVVVPRLTVRQDFTQTFDITMIAGRPFERDYVLDPFHREVLINETLQRYLGWRTAEEAIGKRFGTIRDNSGTIIITVRGVVKDFHVTSLHQEVKPFVLIGPPENNQRNGFFIKFMAVKLKPEHLRETIQFIEGLWKESVTDRAFEYSFLDDNLGRMYRAEEDFNRVAVTFTSLAIFIACLGLFGLAAYSTSQRTKEIGVRKVLGASIPGIIGLLSTEFLRLVLLANIVAWPVAYVVLQLWLERFAYRVSLSPWVFVIAAGSTLVIALATVSYQAVKAASANPVKALKYE
ncbi:ABC transporter permease [bacterium]|nr:ABC transporter permease [bacterium]